jgi:hypothetical protein
MPKQYTDQEVFFENPQELQGEKSGIVEHIINAP